MTLEIIIIAIFAFAAVLAAILAVHNIKELSDAHSEIDILTEHNTGLSLDNARLTHLNDDLARDLEVERTNSKELRQIIIDYEIAAKSQQEENQLNELEPDENDEILQVNAKERLPAGHTNVISGMPYTAITNHASEQWKLQCDENTFTGDYGIRCYSDNERVYFLAAMGSAYGRTIGDAFRVTLKCGTVMYVMLAEYKDDGTDPNFFGHPAPNYDEEIATCILEFIYDPEKIDAKVRGENGSGTFTVFDEFGGLYGDGGDIVKIEYLGRRWEP